MWTRNPLCRSPYYLSDSLPASLSPLSVFDKIFHRSPSRSATLSPLQIGPLRGICCSQGGMGRKKGGWSSASKVASAPTYQSGIEVASSPVQLDKTGAATLVSIVAKPGAKHSSITSLSDEGVGVAIGAAPVEGAANTELLAFLASVLAVKKSAVGLKSGARGRHKVVRVEGLTPLQVETLLQAAL